MSSASYVSNPPSDHEDTIETQFSRSADEKALYEESRRLTEELDARTADLSSGTTTNVNNVFKKHGKVDFL